MTRKSFSVLQILTLVCMTAAVLSVLFLAPQKAEAAFPIVQTTSTSSEDTAVTTHDVSLPSGTRAGDFLVILFSSGEQDTSTVTTPLGWSVAFDTSGNNPNTGDDLRLVLFYKQATGTEGSTVVITTSDVARSAHQVYRISGASAVEATSASGQDDVDPITPNPPILTPSWGAKDTLWLTTFAINPEDITGVTAPSNYTNLLSSQSSFSESDTAIRNLHAASEDPGTFSGSTGGFWIAGTVAIKPRSALIKPPNNLGLVGYWSFDEGTSTQATDFSGNGNTGTTTLPWTSGKRGKAINFGDDGTAYVGVGNVSALNLASAGTIAGWFYATQEGGGGGDFRPVAGKVDGSNDLNGYQMGTYNSHIFVGLDDGVGEQRVDGVTPVTLNAWHHGVATWDGSTVTLYLDGAFDNSTGQSKTPTPATHSFSIGKVDNFPQVWDGKLDEIRIYSRALSASEVAKLYESGAVKFNTSSVNLQAGSTLANGLVGHWTFDGADVTTTITDRSGQNNHGYFNGGATSSATVIGKLGQALTFDGSDDRVAFTAPSLASASFSISGWVYENNLSSDRVWFSEGDASCSDNNDCIHLRIKSDGSMLFGFYSNDLSSSAGVFTAGSWHHVAYTYNVSNGSRKIYLNGREVATETGAAAFTGSTVAEIGRFHDGGGTEPWLGKIDDVRIYTRALSPAEVKQLYQLGTTKIVQ